MAATQVKKGYLRGVRGLILIPLNPDGSDKTPQERHPIKTPQAIELEMEVLEGESFELRGGDRPLLRGEEPDTTVGVNLTITDARFDLAAVQYIAGGTLITQTSKTGEEIIGWEAPTIEQQSELRPFALEVYVANYDEKGGVDGFIKYEFPYCIGRAPAISHSDREWGTPEFEIRARQNPAKGGGPWKVEFVDTLPTELQ
ncbi:MAG: hypothetical protein HPY70_12660 [Firmicutes bacterium]|nr:hypothetical protein [Bacillota bacterium]